jgi:co-chaperonin GroES (HSP10)
MQFKVRPDMLMVAPKEPDTTKSGLFIGKLKRGVLLGTVVQVGADNPEPEITEGTTVIYKRKSLNQVTLDKTYDLIHTEEVEAIYND